MSSNTGDTPDAALGRTPDQVGAARLREARAAVLAFFALLGISNGVWVARIPAIKQHLQLSDGLLGVALLAAPVGLVLVVLLAGRIVDRGGSRSPTLAAGFCAAVLPVALGLAPDVAALMAALFCFGLAGAILDVSMNAQAVLVERGYRRPLMTSFHACYSFGGLAGALLGGLFAWAGVSPAVNFLATGAPLAVLALLAGRWLIGGDPVRQAGRSGAAGHDPGRLPVHGGAGRPGQAQAAGGGPDQPGRAAVGALGWSLPVFLLGLLALCSLLGEGSADGWSAVYLHDNLGASAGFAALGYAAFSVTMAFGRLAGDRLALRFGPVLLVRCCGLLAAAGLAVALITASPAGAVAGFACFGAGLSCTFPQLLSAAGNADPVRPGTVIAQVAGLGYLGMLAGPVLIGGLAAVAGLPLALCVPVILALCIALGAGQVGPGVSRRRLRR